MPSATGEEAEAPTSSIPQSTESSKDTQSTQTAVSGSGESSELTTAVDELLQQLQTRFSTLSEEMLSKMDDMSRRLDSLEAQLRGAVVESASASASASANGTAGSSQVAGGRAREGESGQGSSSQADGAGSTTGT